MKKIVALSVLAVFFIAPITFAQKSKVKVVEKKEQKLEHMEEELDLSDDQLKKIEAIQAKYKLQEEANKEEVKLLREKRKKIIEAKKTEMKSVLTPEQEKIMEKMQKGHNYKKHTIVKEDRKYLNRKETKTQGKEIKE